MAGQYSHKLFFRRVPHSLFHGSIKEKTNDLEINFSGVKEKDVDSLFLPLLVCTLNFKRRSKLSFRMLMRWSVKVV